MTTYQEHQSLVNEHQEAAQTIQRSRMHAFAFQAGIWILLFCLKGMHAQQTNLIATMLFGLFLASRLKNFTARRNLDIRMTQITLEGLKLENKNYLGNFFHDVLQQFGIIRIMLQRAIFDLMALYFFANAAYHLTLDYNPSLALNLETYYPALGILGFFFGDLYYKPLKPLMEAKQAVATA